MKRVLMMSFVATGLLYGMQLKAQDDKSKRPSPPAVASQKLKSGATISIDYSQPSVKGRTIGKDLEPMDGKVWRTGANEATVFETDKDVMVEGKKLPAGKYAMFTIFNEKDVTVIFNKTWKQWGAFKYNEAEDQLRVTAEYEHDKTMSETLKFDISPKGEVTLLWGPKKVEFDVK
ncbi:MAG TPA: DUF2911 domain-containing protein [Ferruginibacter sp.]|nr:DUF2911 domain-containing protein [Ferruginibacter sp.]